MKLFVLFFAVLFVFVYREYQDQHADISRGFDRASVPGKFIRLPEGNCHYVLKEPAAATGNDQVDKPKLILMIHGMFTGGVSFQPEVDALVANGYRVLVPDLWCRGWSDCPAASDAHLTVAKFISQLVGLVTRLDLLDSKEQMAVVGLSMGGAVAANFAVYYPNLISHLVLLAPAGIIKDKVDPITMVKSLPGASLILELLMPLAAPRFSRRAWLPEADLAAIDTDDHPFAEAKRIYGSTFGRLHAETEHLGRMTVATLRNFDFNHQHDTFEQLGRVCQQSSFPILVLWGVEDQILPFSNSAEVMRLLGPCGRLVSYPGVGHALVYTKADEILKQLDKFLNGK